MMKECSFTPVINKSYTPKMHKLQISTTHNGELSVSNISMLDVSQPSTTKNNQISSRLLLLAQKQPPKTPTIIETPAGGNFKMNAKSRQILENKSIINKDLNQSKSTTQLNPRKYDHSIISVQKTKEDMYRDKAKKASEKLLRDKFETEWKQVIVQADVSKHMFLDVHQMREVMQGFYMIEEGDRPKKKAPFNAAKVVNQDTIFDELVTHLSSEGVVSLAFLKNAIREILSLEPEPCKTPQPKAIPHFLFPTGGGNLSF